MIPREAMAASVIQFPMAVDRASLSPAPKCWDITIPAPVATPTNTASRRKLLVEYDKLYSVTCAKFAYLCHLSLAYKRSRVGSALVLQHCGEDLAACGVEKLTELVYGLFCLLGVRAVGHDADEDGFCLYIIFFYIHENSFLLSADENNG